MTDSPYPKPPQQPVLESRSVQIEQIVLVVDLPEPPRKGHHYHSSSRRWIVTHTAPHGVVLSDPPVEHTLWRVTLRPDTRVGLEPMTLLPEDARWTESVTRVRSRERPEVGSLWTDTAGVATLLKVEEEYAHEKGLWRVIVGTIDGSHHSPAAVLSPFRGPSPWAGRRHG